MKSLAVSAFKMHALRVIDEVSKTHEEVVVTKRGKPVARLIPFRTSLSTMPFNKLRSSLVSMGDIVTPLGDGDWNACQ